AERRNARTTRDEQEHRDRHEREHGRDDDEHAERGRDALATAAAQERRETVPDDRGEADRGDHPRDAADMRGERRGGSALPCIEREHEHARSLAEYARDVGRTDVPAALLANIDTAGTRDDHAERN